VAALWAPGIAPGTTFRADLQDVAPTILELMGQPVPGHMDGRPFSVVGNTAAVREDRPASSLSGPHTPQFEYSEEDQAIIEQRLADLGYLE
jgi:arylsulfatase A-like enzyme